MFESEVYFLLDNLRQHEVKLGKIRMVDVSEVHTDFDERSGKIRMVDVSEVHIGFDERSKYEFEE